MRIQVHGLDEDVYITDGELHTTDTHGNRYVLKVEQNQLRSSTITKGNTTQWFVANSHRSTYKNKKLIKTEFYDPDARRNNIMIKNDLFYIHYGKKYAVKHYSDSSGFHAEEVHYNNGNLFYRRKRGQRDITLFTKDGRVGAVINSREAIPMKRFAYLNYAATLFPYHDVDSNIPLAGHRNLVEYIIYHFSKDMHYSRYASIFKGDWRCAVYSKQGNVTSYVEANSTKISKAMLKGKKQYFMDGICVSERISKGTYNAQDIVDCENITIRANLIREYGIDKMVQELVGTVVDKQDGYTLLSLSLNNENGGPDTIQVVRMECPSTNNTHIIRVPSSCATAKEAIQWTFGINEHEMKQGMYVEIIKET